jgi:hypothetical protein
LHDRPGIFEAVRRQAGELDPELVASQVAGSEFVRVAGGLEHSHVRRQFPALDRSGRFGKRQPLRRDGSSIFQAGVADVSGIYGGFAREQLDELGRAEAAFFDAQVQVLAFATGSVGRDLVDSKIFGPVSDRAAGLGNVGRRERRLVNALLLDALTLKGNFASGLAARSLLARWGS